MVQLSLSCGGLSLCGSLSARLAGVRIVFIGFFGWCAARSFHAHLDRRGGCACCAGVPVRGSPGTDRAAFGGFGELPGGRPSVSGESLETPGVQFMSVSKRLGSLCSGARGSEVGGEQCKQST